MLNTAQTKKGDRFHTNANEDQLKAIQTTEGALLIIAGPGSGKTFTLVEYTLHII